MMTSKHNSLFSVLFCLLVLSTSLQAFEDTQDKPSAGGNPSQSSTTDKAAIDPCSLLTRSDIQDVQGEAVKDTKSGTTPGGVMTLQCIFQTETFAKSITLTLTVADPASASSSPRSFWQRQFHPPGLAKKQHSTRKSGSKKEGASEEEESSKSIPVRGIGEEAFWIANPVAGALYVLRGNLFFRISLGGIQDKAARKEKTETLARAVLRHLPKKLPEK